MSVNRQVLKVIHGTFLLMAYISTAPSKTVGNNVYGVKNIARIVGLVCIVGFFFDIFVLGLPPQSGSEWRIGFIQEFANRSIILLFGLALFMYGNVGSGRSRLRFASRLSMILGVVFFLLCMLSVVDSIRLSQQTVSNISTQESQLQSQLEQAQANPDSLPENVDLNALDQVSQQLTQRADTLRSSTKRTIFKTGVSNIGNLVIVGAGLLGLGRCGMGLSRMRG